MEVALKRLLMSQWTADIQVDKVTFLKAVMSFAGEFAFHLFIFFYDSMSCIFFGSSHLFITFCMVLYVPYRYPCIIIVVTIIIVTVIILASKFLIHAKEPKSIIS